MHPVIYKKRKVGNCYLVWFQNSNSFIHLEEPAWFVLKSAAKRYKSETIASELSEYYGFHFEESISFVRDVRKKIEVLNEPTGPSEKIDNDYDTLANYNFECYSVRVYRINNKDIVFSYHTRGLENYLHPLISHLECPAVECPSDRFELFLHDSRVIFRFNGEIKGTWGQDESHLVKGLVFIFLINSIYAKSCDDWLMTVHASAVTNGRKTILFSAPPGSGKTTIAGLLQAEGYKLVSDDFVPIERNSFCAYPFPIAMSVKTGSVGLLATTFPSLRSLPENTITPEKVVRYVSFHSNFDGTRNIYPVHEFVFIEYNPAIDFLWEKLDTPKALKLLLDQAWIPPGAINAQIFLDTVPQKSFYKLTYSNNKKALETIVKLFDYD